jgi:ComF family protein
LIGVPAAARRVAEFVLEGLLPADCLLCAGWLPWRQEGGVCPGCWERLHWAPGSRRPRRGPLAAVAWAADYGGDIRHLVHLLKFERFDPVGIPLGRAAARRLPRHSPCRDDDLIRDGAGGDRLPPIVVPVPLHWTRRWRRGYNPAALLACGVARELALPILSGALVRRRRGRHQVGLGRRDRLATLAGVFAARPSATRHLRGRPVLLVDDVVTTGATLEACATALRAAGASRVVGLGIARTPKRR